jgi:hypothetical protein
MIANTLNPEMGVKMFAIMETACAPAGESAPGTSTRAREMRVCGESVLK